MKIVMTTVLVALISTGMQGEMRQEIVKNNMKVSWSYMKDQINFSMEAPTKGWVTIGFNDKAGMTGAYLLMGRVVNNRAEVVEHYTKSPGNYKSIDKLGESPVVSAVNGSENNDVTKLEFSLPVKAGHTYARNLNKGSEYIMTLAYSRDDDFQHHSMMRTSVNVKL